MATISNLKQTINDDAIKIRSLSGQLAKADKLCAIRRMGTRWGT